MHKRIGSWLTAWGLLSVLAANCQERLEGTVSYMNSQHVYVRFGSTAGLSDGDTLFAVRNDREVPVLVILNHSSTSCVCEPVGDPGLNTSMAVSTHPISATGNMEETPGLVAVTNDTSDSKPLKETVLNGVAENPENRNTSKQVIHGRISASSYSDLANRDSTGRQAMRYTVSFQAQHLRNTDLSVESHVSFRHSSTNWEEVRTDVFKGLKIYNLSARYDFSESMYLLAGRKINPKLSSAGAIDGVQFEKEFGSLTTGLIAGSRPDYADYSINMQLYQYGGYLACEVKGSRGIMQSTLAFIEQRNGPAIDRRFVYIQHTNSMVRNLYFYGSAEVDLYKKVEDRKEAVFDLYNMYVSARYRIIRPLSVRLSYSARNNLIYYESYKDFLDRLLEDKALQGWRAQVNYRPFNFLYMGVHAGYRIRKDDPVPSMNAHGYLTYANLPAVGGNVTISTTWMRSAYLDGMIYGVDLDRELIPGKLNINAQYHFVEYLYRESESELNQHVGEVGLYWSMLRKLSLAVHYEGTFGVALNTHRLYLNLSWRF